MNLNKLKESINKRFRLFLSVFFGFFVLFQTVPLLAETNPETFRFFIQSLSYLANDYSNAVSDKGQIINKEEYAEMQEISEASIKYLNDVSTKADTFSYPFLSKTKQLDSLIKKHSPPSEISSLALEIKSGATRISGIELFPTFYPDWKQGKAVYIAHCAKCHGDKGLGDGQEGLKLNPAPRNFHEQEKMRKLSPFAIFNTVRCGVEGTGMKAHPEISDKEVWNVAFYVLALRYQQPTEFTFDKSKWDLKKISKSADADFYAEGLDSLQIAQIRWFQNTQLDLNSFLQTAVEYLNKALEKVGDKDYNNASKLITASYLEGIEPLEMELKKRDGNLKLAIEKQFNYTKTLVVKNASPSDIATEIKNCIKLIKQAEKEIASSKSTMQMTFLMTLLILLREGLEAFLVLLIILSVLNNTNNRSFKKWVHFGWISSILFGVILWFIGQEILSKFILHFEVLEGVISIFAIIILLYLGFWMHRKSEINKWKEFVQARLNKAELKGGFLAFAGLSFFVTFREVFESVLFLSTLNLESGNQHQMAIGAGFVFSLIVIIVVAYAVIHFTLKLPIPTLFKISTYVMLVLAIVLMGKAVHSFQESALCSSTHFPFFESDLLGIFPTIETLSAQIILLLICLYILKKK